MSFCYRSITLVLMLSCLHWLSPLLCYQITSSTKTIDQNTQEVAVSITLDPQEMLYKDTCVFSVAHPADITLTLEKTTPSAQRFFDKQHDTTQEGYAHHVTFRLKAEKKPASKLDSTQIHLFFKTTVHTQAQEYTQQIEFTSPTSVQDSITTNNNLSNTSAVTAKPYASPQAYARSAVPCAPVQPSLAGGFVQKSINTVSAFFKDFKNKLSGLFQKTGSPLIRFLVAFGIGLLLSLTPCIFPMIPITVGVLQANKTNTTLGNFLLALCYTLGISFTFALLGFVAALGSCVFGELQGSPWVIIPLVAVFAYLAFSMLGFYELYIPRFMQPDTGNIKGGSPLSAFTFGMVSGLIASPCSSPGLLLVLSYVTTLSSAGGLFNYLEGFALLFVFGIGSSLPLLLVGTFSGALSLLPQAGMWMVEVKKFIGLMLLGMCFYYLFSLEYLIPAYIVYWLATGVLGALGVYYFADTSSDDSFGMRFYKKLLATLLIVLASYFGFQGYKYYIDPNIGIETREHTADYNTALKIAREQNKNLIIDIGATNCAACKKLDAKIFKNTALKSLFDKFIVVKIEADVDQQAYNLIKKHFADYIKGFPTVLIVDSKTERVLKNWAGGGELFDITEPELTEELTRYI